MLMLRASESEVSAHKNNGQTNNIDCGAFLVAVQDE